MITKVAADDASKVTPDMGLKDADKLDSNILVFPVPAGREPSLANQNPDSHQWYALEDESKIQLIVASDLVYDAEREIR